jgi:hypothetical protein
MMLMIIDLIAHEDDIDDDIDHDIDARIMIMKSTVKFI